MRDGKCSLLRDCFHLEVQSSWSAMSTSWHDVTLNDSTHACMWIDTNATHKNSAMLVANFMFKKLIKERIWRWYPYWNCISDSINDHTSMPHSHQNKNRYMSSFHHSSTMALGLPVYSLHKQIYILLPHPRALGGGRNMNPFPNTRPFHKKFDWNQIILVLCFDVFYIALRETKRVELLL